MGIFEEVRFGIAQLEIRSSRAERERAVAQALEQARSEGCDVLVVSNSSGQGAVPELYAIGDAGLDGDGSMRELVCAGRAWNIALGEGLDMQAHMRIMGDAHPWTRRDGRLLRATAPAIIVNPVGMSNAGHKVLAYDGASRAVRDDGRCMVLSDRFAEDFAIAERFETCEGTEDLSMEKTLDAIVSTMRRFDRDVLGGGSRWVIGLSGGLDSSIVAALLVEAFGPARVVGYNLATHYNTQATRDNAGSVAAALEIDYRTGSIDDVVTATRACAALYGYDDAATDGIVLENIQARVRGHMLSTFAAAEGGVVANNGNRVECALGYATLYGDAIGALAPIADLTKVELFDLARALNGMFGCDAVPANLLPIETEEGLEWEVPPSAELAAGQRDPMKWYYHDWLISELLDVCSGDPLPIMERYKDGSLQESAVGKWIRYYGLDDPSAFVSDLEGILALMQRSAFKRIQAPPAIAIASRASVQAGEPKQGALAYPDGYEEMRGAVLKMRRFT